MVSRDKSIFLLNDTNDASPIYHKKRQQFFDYRIFLLGAITSAGKRYWRHGFVDVN